MSVFPLFKLLHHFNETGTVHGHAGNAIIQKVNQIGIAFFLCNFGEQLEQGKAAAVFVKDLSRLGRNYIEVGRLTEEFFPDHDIRLIAVSDNIDTAEGENELAPIRNLFNEWYARDISKKRRISNKIKGNSGEPMGLPPYGYIKDPNNPKHWVIDEEAAQVVRRIFDMTLEGFGTEQIATQFEKEAILTPQAYWIQKGIGRPGKSKTRHAQ